MKFVTLLPAFALSLGTIAAVPASAHAPSPSVQDARADNLRDTEALKARIATVQARIAAGRSDGKVTAARATRLNRQIAQVQASMTRLNRKQGFVSAAELASYTRTLGQVDVALDRYGVPRGYGDDALVAGSNGMAVTNQCRPEATAALVGHAAADNETLKRLTGSQTVRRLAPGAMATKDYRQERLTVHLDGAGKVIAASCG